MSTTNETPVAATTAEAVAPSSTLETTVPTTEPTAEPATQPTTTTEAATTDPAITEPTAVAATPAAETAKDGEHVKAEATPITSGNLGYKTGPLKLFKYSQRYFWLGDEAPLDESTISHFHKGNHENKHHTAAHASQTGKGLLLFAKRAEDKAQPEGIFNLADVTDVTKEGSTDFSFKIHDKKQSFQATNSSERDGWLAAIKNAHTEATSGKDALRETDGYKDSYKKYFGTAGVAAVAAGAAATVASKEAKTEDKAVDGTPAAAAATTAPAATKTEAAAAKKEKSRSRSRGPLGLFKQTKEKTEASVEQAKEKAAIKKEEKSVAKEQKNEEKVEEKKTDEAVVGGAGAAVVAGGAAAATAAAVSTDKDATETKTPIAQKRTSRFGSVGNIFGSSKKASESKTTTEPIAAEAPKVDSPVESGAPLTETVPTEVPATTTAAEATPAAATEAVAAPAATASAATVEPKKPKEKSPSSGIKGFFSKKEAQAEKKVEEKKVEKEEKKAAKEEEKVAEPASEVTPAAGATTSTPFAASAVPAEGATATEATPEATTAAATTAPAATAAAAGSTPVGSTKKEERRRSIFDTFKSKPKVAAAETKDTTTDGVAAPGLDEPKDKKLFNLFRSSSKKVPQEPASTEAPPVPSKDEVPALATAATTETPAVAEAKTEVPTATEAATSAAATEAPLETSTATQATTTTTAAA